MALYPYTKSTLGSSISTSLSTQILVKVNNTPVGAIQTLSLDERRGLKEVTEIGTDGIIEIVPSSAATFGISVDSIAMDRKRLPEMFNMGFISVKSQRKPFTIHVFDFANVDDSRYRLSDSNINVNPNNTPYADGFDINLQSEAAAFVLVTEITGCWWESLSTKFSTSDYIISLSGQIKSENINYYFANPASGTRTAGIVDPQAISRLDAVELASDTGLFGRRGSLDARGLGSYAQLISEGTTFDGVRPTSDILVPRIIP